MAILSEIKKWFYMIRLNNNWEFAYTWTEDFMKGFIDGDSIRLPHNIKNLPLHNAQDLPQVMICGYRHTIEVPKEIIGQKVFLIFDAVAPSCEVYLNNELVGKHEGGYTRFSIDISKSIKSGKNTIAVKVDCHEIWQDAESDKAFDFITCAGIYRDVWLDIRPNTYIKDVSIATIDENRISLDIETVGEPMIIDAEVYDAGGSLIASEKNCTKHSEIYISQAHHWSVSNPYIYRCVVFIDSEDGEDYFETTFGIRTAKFESDGFYLNGEKTFLRGLNRHQMFPYIGYAATESLQREDARILKEDCYVNCVRTWHYPPSEYFIDECDRQGICVLMDLTDTDFFAHDEENKNLLENARCQINQFKNHPSIVMWGALADGTYDNGLIHEMDPSRQTYAVCNQVCENISEDVYAYTDYSHNGGNFGCLPKNKVMVNASKPYIIAEAAGWMIPTKAFDDFGRRQDQAIYHARVLDTAMAMGGISGSIQNSMCDYATRKNFGSGDRVRYHGVLDQFRNPKLAAYMYKSQKTIEDTFMAAADFSAGEGADESEKSDAVLALSTNFCQGDYAGGKMGSVYAFTNADEIKLYRNDELINSFKARDWDSLEHGPVEINDMIGSSLEEKEGLDGATAQQLKKCFDLANAYGVHNLSFKDRSFFNLVLKKSKLSIQDFEKLYNKYVTDYARGASWKVDALKDDKIVKSISLESGEDLYIEANVSATTLLEGSCYDMALVRIRIVDKKGNLANYSQVPVAFATEGVIDIVGPMVTTAEGGMCGTIVKTTGWDGYGKLIIYTEGGMETTIDFNVVILEK